MVNADIYILPKAKFLQCPKRIKAMHGGRGSGKSFAIADTLLVQAMESVHRILCTREFQVSISDSVHRTLADRIEAHGIGSFWDVQRTRIVGANGSEFFFAGLARNIDNIKSIPGLTRCWVEEAHSVSQESWDILIPTIRDDDSEIWVSFNPRDKTDATYKMMIEKPQPDSAVVEVNWQDNPWFPKNLRAHMEHMYSVDPDAAAHVYGGKLRKISKALVLKDKCSVAAFTPGADWDGPYQGVDWGFSQSPTTMVRLWIHGTELYVEHEAYGVGVEITDTPALFDMIPNARKYVTRADNARPEMISHLQNNGYPEMVACEKGKGSVEDGVAHLRGYSRIVVHPRCEHAIEEFGLWSYKQNRAGDILPILIDANDHCWDAARYAVEPVMKQVGSVTDFGLPEAPLSDRSWAI